jgi:predicted dithiol-disulfide oxidoreductase (DUF899 family)
MKVEATEPKTDKSEINPAKVVSRDEWLVARKDLLTREKELTRLRDEVSRHRRGLPWVKVDKQYIFDGPDGKETLGDLFEGRSQLIVYHFMLGPGWKEGCKSCSFLADHFDGRKLASAASGRDFRGFLARTIGRNSILSETNGLAFQMALFARERFQFRLSRFVHRGSRKERKSLLQLRDAGIHQR